MKIEPFVPFNTLIKAVKVSPTYVEQGEVSVTGESLAQGLSLGTVLRSTFTGLQVQGMGTKPLKLNAPANFIPVQAMILLSNTTIPFDFSGGSHIHITDSNTTIIFDGVQRMQALNDNIPFIIRQDNQAKEYVAPLVMTTANGNDATEGDSTVDVYIFGYYL